MTGGRAGVDALRAEVAGVLPAALAPADEGSAAGAPEGGGVVVWPGTAEEAATLLSLASTHRWPVRVEGPGGGGSGGGARVEGPHLVVRSDRMAAVEDYEPADLTITVGGGLRLGELDQVVRPQGQWLPLDPSGWRDRSVGGLVGSGASGPLRAGFGTVRDHLLGATLVTADGRILELGGRVVKNVAGFDLLRLTVGSGGTLGFLARATLRLHPVPQTDRTLLFEVPTLRAGGALARRLALLPAPVAAVEWLGRGIPGVTDGAGEVGDRSLLALRLTGGASEVASIHRRATEAAGVPPSQVLEGRDSAAFFDRVAGAPWSHAAAYRASVLPALLPELVEHAVAALPPTEGGAAGWYAAHVTAGVIRLQPGAGAAPSAFRELADWVRLKGGSFRGPGAPPVPPGGAERVAALEEGIRSVFDPGGILVGRPGVGA